MLHLLRFVSDYYTEFAGSCRKDVRMTPRRDHLAMLLPVSRIDMAEVTWEEFAAHIEHFAYAEAYRLGGTSDVAQLELVRWATLLYDPFEDTDPFLQAPWFGHPPDRVVIQAIYSLMLL
jgi:hypothetical protein